MILRVYWKFVGEHDVRLRVFVGSGHEVAHNQLRHAGDLLMGGRQFVELTQMQFTPEWVADDDTKGLD